MYKNANKTNQSFFLLFWILLIPSFMLGQTKENDLPQTTVIKRTILSVNDPNLCLYRKEVGYAFSMQKNSTKIDQGFIFNENGSIAIAKTPNKCIDLLGGTAKSGTLLIVMTCTDNKSPKWYYNESDQTIRLQSNNNKCIQGEGDQVRLQGCSDSAFQQFILK